MNKKNALLALSILLLLAATPLSGQSSFRLDPKTTTFIDNALIECIYKYTINAPLRNNPGNEKQTETYNTILQANSSVSKFWDWHSFKKDSIIYSSVDRLSKDSLNKLDSKYHMKVIRLFLPTIFKNYPKGTITVTDIAYTTDYISTENKTEQKWELNDDTLMVCGYLCNKAVTSFGGKKWTVWYAPEITISDGPWKLYGLPGLILKATDSTSTHSFEAIAIRNSVRPIYIDKNIQQFKIEKKLLEKRKKEFELLETKDIFDSPAIDLKGEKTLNLDDKRVLINRKIVYCPLEE